MERRWFKAKTYGYGWYPASWQGWLVLLVYFGATGWLVIRARLPAHAELAQVLPLIFRLFALTIILLAVCYRTGEKPGWHWGEKKDHE